MGPPESTSKEWILLFYGSGSKTGSTTGVFGRYLTLFKFKRSQELNSIGPINADKLQKKRPLFPGVSFYFFNNILTSEVLIYKY